jgi:hypothetical protein
LSVIQASSKSQIGLPALENFDYNMENNEVWERIIEDINIEDSDKLGNCE